MPLAPDLRDASSLPEKWKRFLAALDGKLGTPVELHCLGGFVVTTVYGVARDTGDLDTLTVLPGSEYSVLLEHGGLGSPLCREFQLYVEQVGVADHPDSYEDRLGDLWPGLFTHLRLRALEIHDLVLAKLTRNSAKDRFDVEALARAGYLDPEVLQKRYHGEMRSYLAPMLAERHDLTLRLWLENYFPGRDQS